MAFTGQLGTSASQLGNIQLGAGPGTGGGGGTIADESLDIDGIADCDVSVIGAAHNSFSFNMVAAITVRGGFIIDDTKSIDGFSSIARLDGAAVAGTVTIAGFADIDGSVDASLSLTIDGIADCDAACFLRMFPTQSVAGVADCDVATYVVFGPTLTVAGIAAITSPGGFVHFVFQPIEGISNITLLPGWGYFDTQDIDGISDIAQDGIRYQNDVLSVDGIADVTLATQFTANILFTVAGFADCDIDSAWESYTSFLMNVISFLSIENLYELLYDTNAFSTVVVVGDAFKNTNNQPTSQGSLSVTCTGTFNRTVTQTVLLTQAATFKKPTAFVTQTLTLTQEVDLIRVHLESVSQTLTLTQEGEGFRSVIQALSLTHSATCTRVQNVAVTQTLTLTQAATRTLVVNREIEQTIVFNVPTVINAPIIGSLGGNQTQYQYHQQFVSVILRPVNCLVVLGAPGQTIILPCPLFGDTQALTSEMNLKRTMTGDTYTYVKRTTTEKLKYTFNIGTYKQIELRAFILAHSHELMTLHNWKGETWRVFMTSNPVEFTHAGRWQPKGERVDVTLEFEGIKT